MMQALYSLFIALGSSLPGRVLASLGIGTLTFTVISSAVATLIDMTWTQWNALPATLYQLASLGGFTDAVGILAAALTTRAALAFLPRLGMLS